MAAGEAVISFERLIGTAQFDLVLFGFWTCAEKLHGPGPPTFTRINRRRRFR